MRPQLVQQGFVLLPETHRITLTAPRFEVLVAAETHVVMVLLPVDCLRVGGSSDQNEISNRLGLPSELVGEAENFRHSDGVYPDNVKTVEVFSSMLTQWRMGPVGPIGFDYGVLPMVMRFNSVHRDDRQDVFEGLRVMEMSALRTMREKRG